MFFYRPLADNRPCYFSSWLAHVTFGLNYYLRKSQMYPGKITWRNNCNLPRILNNAAAKTATTTRCCDKQQYLATGWVSPVDLEELIDYLASWFSIAFGNSTSFNFSLPTDKPPPPLPHPTPPQVRRNVDCTCRWYIDGYGGDPRSESQLAHPCLCCHRRCTVGNATSNNHGPHRARHCSKPRQLQLMPCIVYVFVAHIIFWLF